jgi:hypothetical protein
MPREFKLVVTLRDVGVVVDVASAQEESFWAKSGTVLQFPGVGQKQGRATHYRNEF